MGYKVLYSLNTETERAKFNPSSQAFSLHRLVKPPSCPPTPFFLSVLTGEKKKSIIVYNLLCSTEAMRKLENSKAFTATIIVCITDVAQMMCMFYIYIYIKKFIFIIYK